MSVIIRNGRPFRLLFCSACCLSAVVVCPPPAPSRSSASSYWLKLIKRGIFKQIHPNAVKAVVVDGKALSADKVSAITTHILLFFGVFFFSCLVLSWNNFDLETTITTTLAIFTNTGMALGTPGCGGYFGMFNGFSRPFSDLPDDCRKIGNLRDFRCCSPGASGVWITRKLSILSACHTARIKIAFAANPIHSGKTKRQKCA